MTQNQVISAEDMAQWLRELIAAPDVNISYTNKADDQMQELQIDLLDIIFVLGRCTKIAQDYSGSCFTVRGDTTDSIRVAIVIAPKNKKNRIKVVKVWKE